MRDILFMKNRRLVHFTPGQAYEEAGHGKPQPGPWDMVSIQRPRLRRRRNLFDGKLLRKRASFVPKQLQSLNWR